MSAAIVHVLSLLYLREWLLFCFSYHCHVFRGDILRFCKSLPRPPAVKSDGPLIVIRQGSTGSRKASLGEFKQMDRKNHSITNFTFLVLTGSAFKSAGAEKHRTFDPKIPTAGSLMDWPHASALSLWHDRIHRYTHSKHFFFNAKQ